MRHIAIISSSVREGRKSHNVSLYFQNYLTENKLATTEIIDLKAYNFPIFEGTLKTLINPAKNVLEFADKIKNAIKENPLETLGIVTVAIIVIAFLIFGFPEVELAILAGSGSASSLAALIGSRLALAK